MGRQPFDPALSPLNFLDRAAQMFPERVAVLDGDSSLTYARFHDAVRRQASALQARGVGDGDRVAVLSPNTRTLLDAHFSVPWAGGVLVALNIRMHPSELEVIVAHCGASLLVFDDALADVAASISGPPGVAATEFRRLADREPPAERPPLLEPDRLLALNYTSGTTGTPKGAMYHQTGAYLQALAMAYHARLHPGAVYLWTLPMFHCNGWCFPWAVTAAGGCHICLSKVDAGAIWQHLREDGVTHFNAAPVVLDLIADHPAAQGGPLDPRVRVGTGGAPPSPALLERMEVLGFDVMHLYGLTETFGPIVACDWQPEWDALPPPARAGLAARQGNVNIVSGSLRITAQAGDEVPADGETLGEVQVRGPTVMLGYYGDAEATAAAFSADGWFRTGDLAVMHPNGYIELRDRSKDIIISGGENIASIEVEHALASHPAVAAVAVVAAPDKRWGEVPVAFVEVRSGYELQAEELMVHARSHLAGFKVPSRVLFGELPKTSTGKIRKTELRARVAKG